MTSKLVRLPDVIAQTGLPRSTIYLRMQQGLFPTPISLGCRTVAWVQAEIEQWIEQRITLSRSAAQGRGSRTKST